jgi:hypothetical protein
MSVDEEMKGGQFIPCAQLMVCCLLALTACGWGQTEKQIRMAFRSIRDDDIPRNGTHAAEWIIANRKALKGALLDELDRTDVQGRGAIMTAVMMNPEYQPDLRFMKRVIAYTNGGVSDELGNVYSVAWRFFDRHYEMARPLLVENLNTTTYMRCILDTTLLFMKRHQFEKELDNYGPHVWQVAGDSLKDDKIGGNAGQAIEFYLMLGHMVEPRLKVLATSKEAQTHDYATAMLDAMKGSRRAYGYLASQTKFGEGGPEWVSDELDKWDPHSEPRKRYR